MEPKGIIERDPFSEPPFYTVIADCHEAKIPQTRRSGEGELYGAVAQPGEKKGRRRQQRLENKEPATRREGVRLTPAGLRYAERGLLPPRNDLTPPGSNRYENSRLGDRRERCASRTRRAA